MGSNATLQGAFALSFQIICFRKSQFYFQFSFYGKRHDLCQSCQIYSAKNGIFALLHQFVSDSRSRRHKLTHLTALKLPSLPSNGRLRSFYKHTKKILVENRFPLNTFDCLPSRSFGIFRRKFFITSLSEHNFAVVDLCRQGLTGLCRVLKGLSMSPFFLIKCSRALQRN